MTNTPNPNRASGAILGLAFGDATGYPTEFRSYAELKGTVTVPEQLRISDDTQMSLAVWSALDTWDEVSLGTLRAELIASFRAWRVDPDNNRAPGAACMSACSKLERFGQGHWEQATGPDSAGCGSAMRAPWIGLHPKVTDGNLFGIAALQAVLTHAPAENVASAFVAAWLTRSLAIGGRAEPGQMVFDLEELARDMEDWAYPKDALGDVWRVAFTTIDGRKGSRCLRDPEDYMAEVVAHVWRIAELAGNVCDALRTNGAWAVDPCVYGGRGFRANECVGVAVGILESRLFAPADGIVRSAETGGDSDSIGAVTGALFGAAFGDVWPAGWVHRLENRYYEELVHGPVHVLNA